MTEPKQDQENEFLKAAGEKERGLVAEFVEFMAENKLWWLTPILIVFLLAGIALLLPATPLGAWVYSFV